MNSIKIITLVFFAIVGCVIHTEAKDKIKVSCVGNSITYGSGIEDRENYSYPAQLQRMLGDEYLVGNFGKPGATLLQKGHRPYIKQEEYKKAIEFAGDIVVIHLGVNDTDPRDWPDYRDYFVTDYLELIDSFKKANPGCRIMIAGITPIGDRHPRFVSGTKQWQDLIRDAIGTVAKIAKVDLIDFHSPLYHYPMLLPDAIHPNEEGAEILAETVYKAITGNYGGLQLSDLYTDYMVLQRNKPLLIQGIADSNDKVYVEIAGQKKEATANVQGKWEIRLDPIKAGNNYKLSVYTDKERKTFEHVAAGEVWLCSGQSNMAFMLKQSKESRSAINNAVNNNIRFFDMKGRMSGDKKAWPTELLDSINHLFYYKESKWVECTPDVAANFSAVAYYFGKMLQDSLNVPVGLICNAIGGSTTESWVDRHTLETEFHPILKDWTKNDFIQPWARERGALHLKNSTHKYKRHPFEPCYLYESGILPLQQYPIKGVIWYQGESNAHNMEAHEKLFKLLVDSWRKNWNNEELPFYYVQLSSLNRPSWTWFRDSQRRLMSEIQHTGMAVSSDYGDSLDVHPRIKKPIGERLARWALAKTYNYNIVPSGPLFKNAIANDEGCIEVSFDYDNGIKSSDGKELRTFEVAEYEGLYYPAKAKIKGNKVVVYSEKVKNPLFIRYGWQPFTRANLINSDGLPASTFRGKINKSH